MIISIWVFLVLGYDTPDHPGAPYVQTTTSAYTHEHHPEEVEAACERQFHQLYPTACICESGWHRQEIRVMGS